VLFEPLTTEDSATAKPGLHERERKAAPQGEAFSFAVNPPVKQTSRLTGQAAKEKLFLGALGVLAVQYSFP
jgi:hypothetical protein